MEETPRASDLQLHVEQVNLALRQLRQTQESLGGLESRLAEMTRECAGILDRWHDNDQRHATAVVELHSRLNEWNDIERRLLAESSTRIHQFERGLQSEWNAIRHSHEEPLRQIEAQTTRITETCLTAVSQALQGFDRAESRLAALEQDLHREVGTLVKDVREALAEMRQGAAPQIGPRQPWSLDNVVKLHNELRSEGGAVTPPARGTLALAEAIEPERMPALAVVEHRAEASIAEPEATVPGRSTRRWILMAGGVVALVALALYTTSQVREGLRQATARAAAAERGADEARTRAAAALVAAQESDRRTEEAQRASRFAERLAAVATAPDVRRFELVAPDGGGTAQVLWSRTYGVSVTASGLTPSAGQAYQVWLLSPGQATSAGLLAIDASGSTRQVFDAPAELPRPILRAMITREPAAGSATPSAPAVLAAAPPPPVTP